MNNLLMSQNTSAATLAQLVSRPGSKTNSSIMSLSKPNGPWIPPNIKKARNHYNRQNESANELIAKELPKGLVSIFNKLNIGNLKQCVAATKELVIETIDHLEMTVDFILKKGYTEPNYAPYYVSLCLCMEDIELDCGDNTKKTFKTVMIDKCREIHELNKTKETDIGMKIIEIIACNDPVKTKCLQTEFIQYEKKLFKVLKGKSVFDDEQPDRPVSNLEVVMRNLFSRYIENPIESACLQTITFGIILSEYDNLSEMFDNFRALSRENIIHPPKLRFLVMDLLELQNNNWIPRGYTDRYIMAEEMFIENLNNLGYSTERLPLPANDGFTDLERNSRDNESKWNKIINFCKYVIEEYEQTHNLDDVIYLLMEDEKSLIYEKQFDFVKAMIQASLELKPKSQTEAGKLLAELLSFQVIYTLAVSLGIEDFLNQCDDYLLDYPMFLSYVANFIAPLLMSSTAYFSFGSLRDSITSLCTRKTGILFIEVLKKILSSKDMQNIKYGTGGILWIYKKWLESDYISLDMMIPINELSKYYTNDRVGVFLVSIALYDEMKYIQKREPLFEIMMHWINENINEDIIKSPQFSRAIAIACFIHCSIPERNSYTKFFGHDHIKLLTNYIQRTTVHPLIVQELEVLHGIQIIAIALSFPGYDVMNALFRGFYADRMISKEAFELWKEGKRYNTGFEEDRLTKYTAAIFMMPFFSQIAINETR